MSAQTKCAPSLSTDTTLLLSVISMFSLYWNVTALRNLEFIPSQLWSQRCCCLPYDFFKKLSQYSYDAYMLSQLLHMCARAVICVYHIPKPNWDESQLGRSQLGRSPPTQLGRTQLGRGSQLGTGTERQTSQLGRYSLLEIFRQSVFCPKAGPQRT